MNSKPSFSLRRGLTAAASFVPKAWTGAWLVLLLLWVVALIPVHLAAFGHEMGPGAHKAYSSVAIGILFAAFATLVLKFASLGALYRIALFGSRAKEEGLGFSGLQLGMAELRLFVAMLVVVLFVMIIVTTMFIIFAMTFNLTGQSRGYDNTVLALHATFARHHTPLDLFFMLYFLGAILFLVFVVLKFSLMNAATVAEHRLVTLNAFGLSAGNVGKLFIGLIICVAPIVITLAASWVGFGRSLHGPRLMSGAHPPSHFHLKMMVHALLSLVDIGLVLPLSVGFLSSAYRQITDLRAK